LVPLCGGAVVGAVMVATVVVATVMGATVVGMTVISVTVTGATLVGAVVVGKDVSCGIVGKAVVATDATVMQLEYGYWCHCGWLHCSECLFCGQDCHATCCLLL